MDDFPDEAGSRTNASERRLERQTSQWNREDQGQLGRRFNLPRDGQTPGYICNLSAAQWL